MRRLLSLLLLLTFVFNSIPAYAEDTWTPGVIVPLAKGAVAPFAGVLLSPEAVAKIVAEVEECPKRIKIEVDQARDVQRVTDEKILADVKADAIHDKNILQAAVDSRNGQIKDLTQALEKSEKARGNNWIWVGGGVVAGALLTIATVVLVGYAK